MADPKNHLYYGDNLTILRDRINAESVDLIYLDPPFNSNATYNVLFKSHDGASSAAQIEAFDDTWHWSQQTEELLDHLIGGGCPPRVADALTAMRNLLGTSDMNAYLVMMTARLVELHRVLKPAGSLYLHCDPTASHYLKITLDAIFGPPNFRNEIVWQRTAAKGDARRKFGAVHDLIMVYGKTKDAYFKPVAKPMGSEYLARFNLDDDDGRGHYQSAPLDSPNPRPNLTYPYKDYPPPAKGWRVNLELMHRLDTEGRLIFPATPTGRIRRKVYLSDQEGPNAGDVWTDISPLQSGQRLGYPTEKPLALLERIIEASCPVDGTVLDPFCGCGTTVDASQKLGRRWIGIDVTYLAVDLIRNRLRHSYGFDIDGMYKIHGIPSDLESARALFKENPFDFERWVVSLIDGTPNEKQVGDKGIDGRVRFYADENHIGQVLVSVKGGKSLNPGMVRDLVGTVQREQAEMGLLITLTKPTPGMIDDAKKSGTYVSPLTGQTYPKVQIITTGELMAHKKPIMPSAILPYIKAKPRKQGEQLSLD